MADLSDVEQALVGLIAAALYPNGTSQPSAVTAACRIYRGWPMPKALEEDLRAGIVNVSVFPTNIYQALPHYSTDWQTQTVPATTITATVNGQTVTLSGTVRAPQNVAIVVDKHGYVYPVQATDTLAGIATALAALVSADRSASSAGTVVTIPGAVSLHARVGTVGTSIREVGRQKRQFFVTIWAADPTTRDAVGKIVHPTMQGVFRLSMPDGTTATVATADDGNPNDGLQKEQLYRRTHRYAIEYATTQTEQDAQVLVETFNVTGGDDPSGAVTIAHFDATA